MNPVDDPSSARGDGAARTRVHDETLRALLRDTGRAIADFKLIEANDRIMVAMSGGKDSYALLVVLQALQRRAPIKFELVAVHLDQGHPGYDGAPLRRFLADNGVE